MGLWLGARPIIGATILGYTRLLQWLTPTFIFFKNFVSWCGAELLLGLRPAFLPTNKNNYYTSICPLITNNYTHLQGILRYYLALSAVLSAAYFTITRPLKPTYLPNNYWFYAQLITRIIGNLY